MKSFIFLLPILLFIPIAILADEGDLSPLIQKQQRTELTESQKTGVRDAYGKLPLYFIENKGQVDGAVKFYEKGGGHATFFTEDGVVIALTRSKGRTEKADLRALYGKTTPIGNKHTTTEAVKLTFAGANNKARIIAEDSLQGNVNYLIGDKSSGWQTNVPVSKAITYEDVYKNIDIKFYGNNKNIEHDIIVHPGGDPTQVKFTYKGIQGLKITEKGDLDVILKEGKIIEERPFIYQEVNGEKVVIDGSFMLSESKDGTYTYGFKIASYDRSRDLVIDPVLVYSTYITGSHNEVSNDIAVDTEGAAYITGYTASVDFPLVNPAQFTYGGGSDDVFITKINPAGTAIVYSTYIGGIDYDIGRAIAVDKSGSAYVIGETESTWDFPLINPLQRAFGGGRNDTFLLKLSPSGRAIEYSTYLGGSSADYGYEVALDNDGAAYVTGSTNSTDFPVMNPIQGRLADNNLYAFVTKINPTGTAIVYSTYLGGRSGAAGNGISVDSAGAAYVTGRTSSTDFPLVKPIQRSFGGFEDAFITKINPAGSAYVYSTYLGGSAYDYGMDIAVDGSGSAYVTGDTSSTDFPIVNPIQGYSGYTNAFVTKINPAGTAIIYSTYLGGSRGANSTSITVDSAEAAYVAGETWSADFPLVNPIQDTYKWGTDVFVSKINPTGSALVFSTYLGGSSNEDGNGIAVDSSGAIYVTGMTYSWDFPIVNQIQGLYAGLQEMYISKITLPSVTLTINIGAISVARGSTFGYDVTATNTTATRQCFQYWENLTIPGGTPYPATGELFGPIRLCLDAGASKTTHLTHGVPMGAPLSRYALNAFLGAYAFPDLPYVVSEDHFNIDVTAFNPATQNPEYSWRLIENGLK